MDIEHLFEALADRHRRHILDSLSQTEGQTLTELTTQLPMTRFGAMKHLRILEGAGLVTSRKVGRKKLHYLNPAPMRDVAGWLENYHRLWEERMDSLAEYLRELKEKEKQNGPDKL